MDFENISEIASWGEKQKHCTVLLLLRSPGITESVDLVIVGFTVLDLAL